VNPKPNDSTAAQSFENKSIKIKQMKNTKETETPMPPGTEAVYGTNCKDVILGRGSGTQNHCGNVTYRKLVYLNKELYVTSSKFDKLKISKAIVAAIRTTGGRFLQPNGNMGYLDIGDKRAWDKTSQALREGQTEIKAKLAAEGGDAPQKVAEYKQVITEQTFLAYALKILQSLYDSKSGIMTSCGPDCPHAKRRATMNRTDAMALQHALFMQQQGEIVNQQQMPSLQCPENLSNDPNNMGIGVVDYNLPQIYPGTTYPSSFAYNQSAPPQPAMQMTSPGEDMYSLEPLPYNLPYHVSPHTQPPQSTEIKQTHQGEDSLDGKLNQNRDTITSIDMSMASYDTYTLRRMLCDDVDMDSEEMNKQLSDIIRRKSHGLIKIDAVEAFEDLVFEEDSAARVKFEFPHPQVANASARSISDFTDRPESLMNMSLLTIDDKDMATESSVKRFSRVSFAPENVSAMSLDIGDDDGAPDSPDDKHVGAYEGSPDATSPLSYSRAVGFPVRKSVQRHQQAGVPTVIPARPSDEINRDKRISTLTFSQASQLQNDLEFSEMTKNIAPPTSSLSLKTENMSTLSMLSVVDESILGEDKRGVNQV
jgi:hypothetical protein